MPRVTQSPSVLTDSVTPTPTTHSVSQLSEIILSQRYQSMIKSRAINTLFIILITKKVDVDSGVSVDDSYGTIQGVHQQR